MFRFRSYPGLSFAYAHMANLHFAISHTISRPIFLENGKLSENLMVFRKINFLNFKKETFNPPSSAQRPQNMVQNHEKPSLSLFRAFGSGICSTPARYRTSRGLDKFGGSRLVRYPGGGYTPPTQIYCLPPMGGGPKLEVRPSPV